MGNPGLETNSYAFRLGRVAYRTFVTRKVYTGAARAIGFFGRLISPNYQLGLTRRLIEYKTAVSDADIRWVEKNLDLIMASSDENRRNHVREVVAFYRQLTAGNLDYFHENITAGKRCPEKKTAFLRSLQILRGIHESLSPAEKNILHLALLLHDVGIVPTIRTWDHPLESERRVRALLRELNYSPEVIDGVAQIVLHHGDYSNLGVDIFPAEVDGFSPALKKQLLITSAMDTAGKPGASNLLPEALDDLLDFYSSGTALQRGFWKLRLRMLFIPVTASYYFGPRLSDQELTRISQNLLPLVQEALNDKVRIYNFSLFQLLARRDPTLSRFLKLTKLVCYLAQLYSEGPYYTVDTDIDFFPLPMKDRAPYVAKMESYLDAIPEDFNPLLIKKELEASRGTLCFGLPLSLSPDRLTLKLL